MTDTERQWRVGELAEQTGLTVRTLHHWDQLGLLRPAERADSGYRLYGPAEVERAYRIVALRRLGMDLESIAGALDGEPGALRPVLERHLDALREAAREIGALSARIERLLGAPVAPDPHDLMEVIRMDQMIERHYSPEQLAQLRERAEALGPEGMQRAQDDWAELIAAFEAERQAGTDPADERLAPLVGRWSQLVQAFTGGDEGIGASLQSMYEAEGAERASRGAISAETMAYAHRAVQAHGEPG